MDPFTELQSDKEAFKKLVSFKGFPHNEVNYERYMYAFCAGASLIRKIDAPPSPNHWVSIMAGRLSDITLEGMMKFYALGLEYGLRGVIP